MGAGVQGFEAYAAADKEGLNVVGGECPTVGLAGSWYSIVALCILDLISDHRNRRIYSRWRALCAFFTLRNGRRSDSGVGSRSCEWDIASRVSTQNLDLYWALSGGGKGTYGVVYSLTSRVLEDAPVSGATLKFARADLSEDTFYKLIGSWHARLIPITDAGCYALTLVTKDFLTLYPVLCSGVSIKDLKTLMTPFTDELAHAETNFTVEYSEYPGYAAGYTGLIYPAYVGNSTSISQIGGRLIPWSVIETNNDALTAAVRNITDDIPFISVSVNTPKRINGHLDNAVRFFLPASIAYP